MSEPFGFRRRCGWCGVQLRGWQLNLCHRCKRYATALDGGPPCTQGSRWGDEPDALRATPVAPCQHEWRNRVNRVRRWRECQLCGKQAPTLEGDAR